MFTRLFAESGLSLDRLRALLEVGAAGSIVKAAQGDAVRQSQYSRQIKELEDFFRTRLIERQGRGTRLTASGRELARISRFFMLGLANFQRGCVAAEQHFRIGAGPTFIGHFLLPALGGEGRLGQSTRYTTEAVRGDEVERRLHDLTLDFAVVTRSPLSRPLQTRELGAWGLGVWMPARWRFSAAEAAEALAGRNLPLALAEAELEGLGLEWLAEPQASLVCDSFLEALTVLTGGFAAAVLPDFLAPTKGSKAFVRVAAPRLEGRVSRYFLAWNPRLLRLNPHAVRRRDWLLQVLTARLEGR